MDNNRMYGSFTVNAQTRRARLTIMETMWQAFRNHLHQPDGIERAAFMLLGRCEQSERDDYYVHRLILVPDHRCVQQHQTIVEPDAKSILESFGQFKTSAASAFLHAHSHPFSHSAHFSGTDDYYLAEEIQGLANYMRSVKDARSFQFLRMVTGKQASGFTGEVYSRDGVLTARFDEICVVGRSGRTTILHEAHPRAKGLGGALLTPMDRARLDRNVNWLGEAGQCAMLSAHVAICGLGGLGAEVLKNCRGLGFRKYTLIDMDRIETSNLNRFSCGITDVGRFKVSVARDFLLSAVPDAEVTALTLPVEDETCQKALRNCDFIVNALDDDSARLNVQVLAARHLTPMLDLGSGIHLKTGTQEVEAMGGQAVLYAPEGPCLLCQGLDPNRIVPRHIREMQHQMGYLEGTDETPTSVVTINSVMGGIAGDIIMKYLTGFSRVPQWISFNALKHEFNTLVFKKRKDCPICGEHGIEGLGIDETMPMLPRAKSAGVARAAAAAAEEALAPDAQEEERADAITAPQNAAATGKDFAGPDVCMQEKTEEGKHATENLHA